MYGGSSAWKPETCFGFRRGNRGPVTGASWPFFGLENEGKDAPAAHPTHKQMESPRRGLQSDVYFSYVGSGWFLRFWP